ncbi:hypothetical protein Dimus_039175 [Dionaea muscipula]
MDPVGDGSCRRRGWRQQTRAEQQSNPRRPTDDTPTAANDDTPTCADRTDVCHCRSRQPIATIADCPSVFMREGWSLISSMNFSPVAEVFTERMERKELGLVFL